MIEPLEAIFAADLKKIDYFIHDWLAIESSKARLPDDKHGNEHPLFIKRLLNYVLYKGGKRTRSLFALASYNLVQKNSLKEKELYKLCASIELIHNATLLHDDVIDKAEQRREKKAAHRIFGNRLSILSGDLLFSQSFCYMVESGSFEVLRTLSQASNEIIKGEILQLNFGHDLFLSFDDYLSIVGCKTATLFAASCKAGAELNPKIKDLEENERSIALETFYMVGYHYGIAFQIIDDVLDYIGDEKNLGKDIGRDFSDKQITLPVLLSVKKNPIATQEYLKSNNFKEFLEFLWRNNIFNDCLKLAKNHIEQSKNQLLTVSSLLKSKELLSPFKFFIDTFISNITYSFDKNISQRSKTDS